jgi:hypothetical protein
MEKSGINFTLFFRPIVYHNIETGEEQGRIDMNFRYFFEISNTGFITGVDTTMRLNVNQVNDLSISLAPFISFSNSGLRWDASLRFNMLSFGNLDEFFEMFVGISSSF